MNEFEAQVELHKNIALVLADLADSDDVDDAEYQEILDAVSDAADLIIEALSLRVTGVEGDSLTLTATLPPSQ